MVTRFIGTHLYGKPIMATALIIVSVLLFMIYAGLIIYYRQGWVAMPAYHCPTGPMPKTTITVVIPARNESDHIEDCLASIIQQTYPANLFEVIVVDDHSTDDTAEKVRAFNAANVRLLSLKDFTGGNPLNSYKKKAIEIAIVHATGNLIVTTDADCFVKPAWLQTIASFYESNNAMLIAAPVSIHCSFNFLQMFQAMDFMTLQGITGASVHRKLHSMCNGANLAYEKEAFNQVGGYQGIDNIASGDDMLLMHKIAKLNPERVMFLKSMDAIVQTAPVNSLKAFFNQRIRWASKADKYDDKTILPVLITVYFFNVLLLLMPVAAILSDSQFSIFNFRFSIFQSFLLLLLGKTVIELIFLYPVAVFFSKQTMLWLFPVMQPFHIAYTVIAGWLGKFGSYQWKERKVK